jgi:hypothetical protein
MAGRRPSEQPFDTENDGPVRQAVANIDNRGRVKFPARIVDGIDWLADQDVLAVLAEPGIINLHSWAEHGQMVLKRRRELLARANAEPATFEIVRALEDRYKRFKIPQGFRPTLTDEMLLHLGLTPAVPTSLYIWRLNHSVQINSIAFRTRTLAAEWAELSDLI